MRVTASDSEPAKTTTSGDSEVNLSSVNRSKATCAAWAEEKCGDGRAAGRRTKSRAIESPRSCTEVDRIAPNRPNVSSCERRQTVETVSSE
jgi:hypothetical protein